ncbi:MAG: SdiA-regulated domain-containing protein [Longimicrobiales bacterium]
MRNVLVAAVLATACEGAADAPNAGVEAIATDSAVVFLDRFDLDERIWYHDLPGRLDEVSGLAFTPDGRLFAHDDERARVHEIDPETAQVGKRFDLGEDLVRGDFEGIAIVGDRFFLITSSGQLYEFREGTDRENVGFRLTDTGLGDRCEVEGLDYDEAIDALLIACKTSLPDRGLVVVHRIPLRPGAEALPDFTIRRADLVAHGIDRSFAPSGVVVSPIGTVLLISGRHDALIEVDRDGRLMAAVELRGGRHPQSEGLEIGPDGTLYISDERNGKEPRLTAYGAPGGTQEDGS